MAKINEQDIDTLRERADIVDVISGYSQLKRSGGHTFKGLCPLHSEKTPSFTVDAAKGLWHCFGCGEGGNIYHFIQKTESLAFPEAVEWLARRVGFDLRYEQMRPGEQKSAGIKLRLIGANEAAASFWHRALMEAPEAEAARRYLAGRNFDRSVAARWLLGYAPGGRSLCKNLLDKGFSQEDLIKAGLARASERDGSLYDVFRERIIFPTWNLQNDVVGFGARALGGAQPKYLNTAETPVFQKSRLMYGLNRAKTAIARSAAVVVEGYTDVIALHESGIQTVVATNGVALGETHFELLKKFTQRVILMFDSDAAGKGAAERGFELQHKLGLDVLVALLPDGRDPADLVTEYGNEGVQKIIDGAQPLMEFKLEQAISRFPLDTPEARARAVTAATEVLGWHPDPVARHEYVFIAARLIGVDPESVQRALGERRVGESQSPTTRSERDRTTRPGHVKLEREALRLMLTRTGETERFCDGVDVSHFTSPVRRELYRLAESLWGNGRGIDARELNSLSPEAVSLYTELTVGAETLEESAAPMQEVFGRLRILHLEREIKSRRATLQDVNPIDEPQKHDELFTELVGLEAERRDLLRTLEGAA
ncbi:MAG: DNA primase [Actinomycetota bacterium]|nr:DNA primase [Actinomycetota bacterium]